MQCLTRSLLLLPTLLYCAQLLANPTLIVDIDGILLGAKNVEVNNQLYDVAFDESHDDPVPYCEVLFNGCDSQDDFFFQTREDAIAASQALLDQVFLDGPLGDFDSDPELVNGCGLYFGTVCGTLTPFDVFVEEDYKAVRFGVHRNEKYSMNDVITITRDRTDDFPGANFAVWSATAIPAPTTIWLIGGGLMGILGLKRRQLS